MSRGIFRVMARTLLKNPENLARMFEERRGGASLLWLARKYNVDHTTIMWHCRKIGVYPLVPLIGGRRKEVRVDRYAMVPEEELDALEQALTPSEEGPINKGKTYFEYVRIAMEKDRTFIDYFRRYHVNPLAPEYLNRKNQVVGS